MAEPQTDMNPASTPWDELSWCQFCRQRWNRRFSVLHSESIITCGTSILSLYINTLWPRQDGRHFADDISNTFSCMKIHVFWSIFHWSLFIRVKLTIFQHWFRQWLSAGQATSYYLNQWWSVYWRIYGQWSKTLNDTVALHRICTQTPVLSGSWICTDRLRHYCGCTRYKYKYEIGRYPGYFLELRLYLKLRIKEIALDMEMKCLYRVYGITVDNGDIWVHF